jgi:hypothetical protein
VCPEKCKGSSQTSKAGGCLGKGGGGRISKTTATTTRQMTLRGE